MAIHSQRHGVCVWQKANFGFSFLPGPHAQLKNHHKTAGGGGSRAQNRGGGEGDAAEAEGGAGSRRSGPRPYLAIFVSQCMPNPSSSPLLTLPLHAQSFLNASAPTDPTRSPLAPPHSALPGQSLGPLLGPTSRGPTCGPTQPYSAATRPCSAPLGLTLPLPARFSGPK